MPKKHTKIKIHLLMGLILVRINIRNEMKSYLSWNAEDTAEKALRRNAAIYKNNLWS